MLTFGSLLHVCESKVYLSLHMNEFVCACASMVEATWHNGGPLDDDIGDALSCMEYL